MGAGALLIQGGNTTLALVGLPLLFPYAWLAFMSICVTIYVALRLSTVRSAEAAADFARALAEWTDPVSLNASD
jgi:hypothetical protein